MIEGPFFLIRVEFEYCFKRCLGKSETFYQMFNNVNDRISRYLSKLEISGEITDSELFTGNPCCGPYVSFKVEVADIDAASEIQQQVVDMLSEMVDVTDGSFMEQE